VAGPDSGPRPSSVVPERTPPHRDFVPSRIPRPETAGHAIPQRGPIKVAKKATPTAESSSAVSGRCLPKRAGDHHARTAMRNSGLGPQSPRHAGLSSPLG
jgi:hypothetical protein